MNNETQSPIEILKQTISIMQQHIALLRCENQWLRERLHSRVQGEIDGLREERDLLVEATKRCKS